MQLIQTTGMHSIVRFSCLACIAATTVVCQPVIAQQQPPNPDAEVILNFPDEVELEALVNFVSDRLRIKVLYDKQALDLAKKKITLRAPDAIPVSSLLGVLQSTLKMHGLLIVDAEVPGWKRIVKDTSLPQVAPTGNAKEIIEIFGRASPVTQIFRLQNADPQKVALAIKPFLTSQQNNQTNTIEVKENGILIITDYASNLLKVTQLIELLDAAKPNVKLEFLRVENVLAQEMEQQVRTLLQAKSKAQGAAPGSSEVEIAHDPRTNHVILIGSPELVTETVELVRSLDVPLGLVTEVYAFRYVSPERIDKLTKELIGALDSERLYKSAIDTEGNLLIVTSTPQIHERIRALRTNLDNTNSQAQSPVRFYKLKNITVQEVFETLSTLQDGGLAPGGTQIPYQPEPGRFFPPGPNRPPPPQPQGIGQPLPVPPAYQERLEPGQLQMPLQQPPLRQDGDQISIGSLPLARVSADPHTNSIIVVGEPAVQRVYEELIRALDKRRPQVLIEVKVVTIDTSDDFTLGVEVSVGDRMGSRRLFNFSSFGLSDVDGVSGSLSIIPGFGYNGVLVDPTIADAVVRALATHRRAKLITAPRVLVNDNATGLLTSVQEIPFTSVNASQTVSTTSFAGFAEAGTTITMTPHISEGDHLQLQFNITLNTFGSGGSEGVPPPRQTNAVESEVTIPNGHTIIVGGLNRRDRRETINGLPFLEHIPILKYAVSNRQYQNQCLSLFFFIRPIILRDDKFKDLKFVSERDVIRARIGQDYPSSGPLLIQ